MNLIRTLALLAQSHERLQDAGIPSSRPDHGAARRATRHTPSRPAAAAEVYLVGPPGDPLVVLPHLTPGQLNALAARAVSVRATRPHFEAAARAWQAFRAPDPAALDALAATPDPALDEPLPFLRAALVRFLEEYPSATNGLSRTEDTALAVLEQAGTSSGGDLFQRVAAREPRPFLGDTTFFEMLRRLATARVPLLAIADDEGGVDLRRKAIALTAAGRDVLDGRRDAVRVNGIDRWRGGVHLSGSRSLWRWDPGRRRLVSWS